MAPEIILSTALVISTIIYTIINFFILFENIKLRRSNQKPEIVAYIVTTEAHNVFKLIIENIGVGSAYNVNVNVINDINRFGDDKQPLSKLHFLNKEINVFPPNLSHKYSIYQTGTQKVLEKEFSLKFDYLDSLEQKYSKTINLSFTQVADETYSTIPDTYIGRIAYYMEKIENKIK